MPCTPSLIEQTVNFICLFYFIPVLCTAPNKYTVVDATGAVKPQCCVDMWVFFSIDLLVSKTCSSCLLLVLLNMKYLPVLPVSFELSSQQSHQTPGCASVSLWSVRQVPAAGVGAEPTEGSRS